MPGSTSRQMHLSVLVHPFGGHPAAWLLSKDPRDTGTSFAHYRKLALIAEQAKFDFVFFADSPALRSLDIAKLRRSPTFINFLEPLSLLGALSSATSRIGLAATVSTSYAEPFNVARQFASLDHISGGRIAWNVVTSTSQTAPLNFGLSEQIDHATRYRQAREFVDIVKGLWDSWEDDAFVGDQDEVVYFDPEKCHVLNHAGEFFSVRGPLNVARPVQGQPVVVQAGGSEAGKQLAAETAEVIFINEKSMLKAQAFARDIRGRMARVGRAPDEIKIMPGLHLVVGRDAAEARAKLDALNGRLHPDVGREMVEDAMGGIDLSDLPLDKPFPIERLPASIKGGTTYFASLADTITHERPPFGELCTRFAGARVGNVLTGGPVEIADHMEAWFREGAADGFMLVPLVLGRDLEDFAALVVPELQRRGLFRRDYEASTLRGHLGLARPPFRSQRRAEQPRAAASAS